MAFRFDVDLAVQNAIGMCPTRAVSIHDGTPEMPDPGSLRRDRPATERD